MRTIGWPPLPPELLYRRLLELRDAVLHEVSPTGHQRRAGCYQPESVAERQPDLLAQPWPALEGRAAELVATKVVDLSDDPRLFAQLDTEARRRWEKLRAGRR